MIEVVKNQLDLGLITSNRRVIHFFADHVGLRLDEILPVRKGHDQYRFEERGSIIKVNFLPDLETTELARSGYQELRIARPAPEAPRELEDPDGNRIRLVTPDDEGVTQIGTLIHVRNLERSVHHYRDVLGFEATGPARFRLGDSVVLLEERADAATQIERVGRGWTYLTVQVRDCDAEVARIEAAGARVATRPVNLGEVARMAMVADPDGNLLEISQRASLTGPLPNAMT